MWTTSSTRHWCYLESLMATSFLDSWNIFTTLSSFMLLPFDFLCFVVNIHLLSLSSSSVFSPSLCLFLALSHTPSLCVSWQPCAMLTTASCWVTMPHTHTHTHPRGVSACYSDSVADKTNNRQIYKNGLKFHLILGDFHMSAALINPVFRHACRFRKTRGARKINRLSYSRTFWSRPSPNSLGTFVMGLKIDVQDHRELGVPKNVFISSHTGCHLSFVFHL